MLTVETTLCEHGLVFVTIVPPVGWAWTIPLKSIKAWKPLRI